MSRNKEQARGCLRCGHIWYAEKATRASKPLFGAGFTPQQQAVNAGIVYQQRLAAVARWLRCPRCGTTKVATLDPVKLAALQAARAAKVAAAQQPTPNLHPARRLIDWSPPRPENRRG